MLRIHAFREDKVYRNNIENTLKPARVNPADYAAIYYAGGHCTMWDFPEDQAIAARIYENNGVIGAVCHGPAGLVNEMPFRAVSEALTAACGPLRVDPPPRPASTPPQQCPQSAPPRSVSH